MRRRRLRYRALFPRCMWRANRELLWLVLLMLAALAYRVGADVVATIFAAE
ncbi:hypothetical protein NA78x_001715 [Anatilimnocola sp. NA78]|uniref:hypothetical protein n=1 Tax=Anatilimnocola sp. NA78 TaxID=3415683 RepID=UPI003CE54AB7